MNMIIEAILLAGNCRNYTTIAVGITEHMPNNEYVLTQRRFTEPPLSKRYEGMENGTTGPIINNKYTATLNGITEHTFNGGYTALMNGIT